MRETPVAVGRLKGPPVAIEIEDVEDDEDDDGEIVGGEEPNVETEEIVCPCARADAAAARAGN